MLTFVLLAALLTFVMVAAVAIPLLRKHPEGRAPYAALAAVLVLAGGGTALYAWLSNWSWKPAPTATTPENMVAQLARRLERNPDDLDGWLKLGRSYLVLQQFPLAARAYQRADRLAGGRSVDALTGLAEALSMSDETELDGRAGRLLEQALEVDPRSPKALYYGALAALRRSDLPVARQRFATLLDLGAPDNIRPLLQRQIDVLDAQIKAGPASPEKAAGAALRVQVNVSIAPAMRAQIDVSAPLFVIVREPGVRGPPLAVKRLTSRFPQSVELTAADAMIAGRTFRSGQSIEVVARIARSGNPVGTTGDPFGLIATRVGDSGVLNLAIDRLTP